MTMIETKKEIETAIANNCPLSLDALLNAYLAVRAYLDVYGDGDIRLEVNVE